MPGTLISTLYTTTKVKMTPENLGEDKKKMTAWTNDRKLFVAFFFIYFRDFETRRRLIFNRD